MASKDTATSMEMTREQQLESLKQEMAKLNQLEAEYLKKKDIEKSGISTTEPLDISAGQRLAVKNLGISPEQSVQYLEKNNPGMDFTIQDGEIFGKKKGEVGPYKALDPGFHPLSAPMATLKDIPADVGDVLADIGAGAAQGYAATVGALPGVLSFNPPLAVGGAMAAGGVAGATAEGLRQALGRALGVNKEFAPSQIALSGGLAAALPGAEALAKTGIEKAAPAAKQAIGRLMGMSKEEAKQMVKNPELFYSLKDIFMGKGSPIEAQTMARESLKNLVENLKEVGLSENEALKASLIGTNVNVDMKAVRSALSEITDPRARAKAAKLLSEARKYEVAQRPFVPEFLTKEARQMGVQGLTQPSKAPVVVPSEAIAALEEEPGLFDTGVLQEIKKPEFIKTPQPPFFDQISAGVSGPAQTEFLTPTTTVSKLPASMTKGAAGYSEVFPTEPVPFSTMLQEPLEFPTKKGLPANLVRDFRQLLQKEAKYSAMGTPAKRKFSDVADILNIPLRELDGLQQQEAAMGRGKDLQKWIRTMAMSKRPLKALTTSPEDYDVMAILQEASQRASKAAPKGKPSFEEVQSAITGAKKAAELEKEKNVLTTADLLKSGIGGLMGHHYGGTAGSVIGSLAGIAASPKTASYGLPIISGAEELATKIPSGISYPLWLEMLRSKQEGEQK